MRSGTLDAAGIRAFAVALTEAVAEREGSAARLTALRDHVRDVLRRLDARTVETKRRRRIHLKGAPEDLEVHEVIGTSR